MATKLQVLIDSDAFVGRFYTEDAHYKDSKRLFEELQDRATPIATTNLVILETATVLSHRSNQTLARRFLDVIEKSQLPIIYVDEQIQREALTIFSAQEKRGTSGVDCANVAVMHKYQIPTIFSYDRFYAQQSWIDMISSTS